VRRPPLPEVPTDWVDENTIRAAFNDAQVWDQVLAGRYRMSVRASRPAPPVGQSGQEAGTLSQMIDITDDRGQFVASAHRYLRPGQDPLFGGRPDPKRLVVGGRMLALRARPGMITRHG
jgi:hypothetical protein